MLRMVLGGQQSMADAAAMVHERIIGRSTAATSQPGNAIPPPEPHHDDLMLIMPHIVRNMRNPTNDYFVTLTSGLPRSPTYSCSGSGGSRWVDSNVSLVYAEGYFDADNEQGRNPRRPQYPTASPRRTRTCGPRGRGGCSAPSDSTTSSLKAIRDRMTELEHYFSSVYPGRKDHEAVQRLKGMCREWEAETLWGYYGWQCSHIRHLRLGFYTGDIFVPEPTVERDVKPVLRLLEEVQPEVISCALDPEASGPDTHYKVLQAISEAAGQYIEKCPDANLRIWGYRNV